MIKKYFLSFSCTLLIFIQTGFSQDLKTADSISFLFVKGNFQNMSLFKMAEEQYLNCIKEDSLNSTTYYNLGTLYNNLGAHYNNLTIGHRLNIIGNFFHLRKSKRFIEKSKIYFKKAIRINPKLKEWLDYANIKLD